MLLATRTIRREDARLLMGLGHYAADFRVAEHPVPCTTNLLGAKGAGEAGTTGALVAIMNAVIDALRVRGISEIDMPVTPARVWEALRRRPL